VSAIGRIGREDGSHGGSGLQQYPGEEEGQGLRIPGSSTDGNRECEKIAAIAHSGAAAFPRRTSGV